MMKKFLFTLALTLFLLPSTLHAEDLTAQEIVRRSDDLMRGDTNQGLYSMTITTPNWQRELKLYVYSVGRDKMFIRIMEPAKEAGIGTLRIKNEMWNYLPNVEKTIKIPPSMMLQPWMGSEFANDDLVKESSIVNDYTHTIVSEKEVDGRPLCVIEFIPRPGAAVIWGKILRWVRKDDFVPLKEKYYNERGKLIKELVFSDIEQVSDRMIPKTWTMTSMIKENHITTIKLIDVQFNVPIDENIFTLTNLTKVQ